MCSLKIKKTIDRVTKYSEVIILLRLSTLGLSLLIKGNREFFRLEEISTIKFRWDGNFIGRKIIHYIPLEWNLFNKNTVTRQSISR